MKSKSVKNEIVTVAVEVKKLGRPVDVNSERQKRLAEKEALKASGVVIKRGRPIVEDSKNQEKLTRRFELPAAGLLIGVFYNSYVVD